MYSVMIVEDDAVIAERMAEGLKKWGLDCSLVGDFSNVTEQFLRLNPQLVILDITLPCFDGYHWCGEIRRVSKVPIIFVSSASDNMNIVMAVSTGADDFISKPFDLSVLIAKVQALLRRTYDFSIGGFLTHNGAVVNPSDFSLSHGEQRIELTRNECRIVQVLFENAGKTVSRDLLMQRLWETDSYVDENTLTVNVTRLRKKLASIGLEDMIVTRKGEGYTVQ